MLASALDLVKNYLEMEYRLIDDSSMCWQRESWDKFGLVVACVVFICVDYDRIATTMDTIFPNATGFLLSLFIFCIPANAPDSLRANEQPVKHT